MKDESQEFRDSSAVCVCELCGITYFFDDPSVTIGTHTRDAQFKKIREGAKIDPEGFIQVDHPIETAMIDGQLVVLCCECSELKKHKSWVWTNRKFIAKYLNERAKKVAEAAYSDEAEAELIQEATETCDRKRKFIRCAMCGGYFDEDVIQAVRGDLVCESCSLLWSKQKKQTIQDEEDEDQNKLLDKVFGRDNEVSNEVDLPF